MIWRGFRGIGSKIRPWMTTSASDSCPPSGRVSVSLLSQGVSAEEILADYPDLEPEDILACIAYGQCYGLRSGSS